MPNVGPMELLLLGILALAIFGPAKFPEIGRSIGRATREFRDTITGTGIDEAISGVNDVRSAVNPTNLAKAAMPAPVKEMAAGVTEMKETFTDPLGLKQKDDAAGGEGKTSGEEAKPAASEMVQVVEAPAQPQA
jgi:sec-independent protein translocase protein TatA